MIAKETAKKLRLAALAVVALIAVAIVGALVLIHTAWFRNSVRRKIISSVEETTGGRVEIASFDLDVSHLRAVVTDFVIHGREPAGTVPFLRIARVEVDLRLFTSLKRLYDISYLGVERPQVNIIVVANGQTNIPVPPRPAASNQTALQAVVDLAVGHFALSRGSITLDSRKEPLDIEGRNLQAQLAWSILSQSYQGQIAIQPLYVLNGRRTPVDFTVTLPVKLTGDRIDINNASITTPLSTVSFSGAVENMKNPRVMVHLNGRIATADLMNAADIPLAVKGRLPHELDLLADAVVSKGSFQVKQFLAVLGHSNIEASGSGSLDFRAQLDLGELSRTGQVKSPVSALVEVRGTGKQNAGAIDLSNLRVDALGGEFDGTASLADFSHYKVSGDLRDLDIQTALRALGEKLPYDGVISGPVSAQHDQQLIADARLTIRAGRRGVPVSGRLNADYSGTSDNVTIDNSYLALPHTRVTLNGSLNRRLNVAVTSHDLNDLLVAVNTKGQSPVALLQRGEASFNGIVTGALSKPRIAGHLTATRFAVEGRRFDAVAADVSASSTDVSLANATLSQGAMSAQLSAAVGLRDWATTPRSPLTVNAAINNADLADALALAGEPVDGYSGSFAATARITGTIGNPQGSANIAASNGTLDGEPYNQIRLQANLTDRLVTLPAAYIDAPGGRVTLSADFRHPRDSFTSGTIEAHLRTAQFNLARTNLTGGPNAGGTVGVNATVAARVLPGSPTHIQLTDVDLNASAHGLRFDGKQFGDLAASANTSGQTVSYNLDASYFGGALKVSGNTRLTREYPTTANLTLTNLPIDRLLVLAGQTGIPAKGALSGSAQVAGTFADPRGSAQLDVRNAVIDGEPIDRANLRAVYANKALDVQQLQVASGPSHVELSGSYDRGRVTFNIANGHLDLARLHTVQIWRPGLAGSVDLSAGGAAAFEPKFTLANLSANVSAEGIAAEGRNFGSLALAAHTSAANRLNFNLSSDLAGATIRGTGSATLAGDDPVDAQLAFSNVTLNRMEALLGKQASEPTDFDAVTDGQLDLNGPALKPERMNGTLRLTRLSFTATPRPGTGKPVTIASQGPLQIALNGGVVRIGNAHLTAPQTDIQATGTASLSTRMLNVNLTANADLGVAQNFDRDLISSGKVTIAAAVHGTFSQPLINGQVTLQNASANYAAIPLGISNANGSVVFSGNNAQIRNLTAESGGGRVTLTGFAGYGSVFRFGLRAQATNVRIRAQQGVSLRCDADIRLSGTTAASRLTGTVTVNQINYAPRTDIGSILARSAPPVQAASEGNSILENMRLDIRVQTAPALAVQAELAQNLQADADLRIRGTASEPGVLGKVTINEGQLVFFGSTYTIDNGTISFYNPVRIEPILDLSLETQAQGVNVTVRVTGPFDNMKLSYTSDPPLQFQEIVGLLAAGTAPTSDPTLLANQPAVPQQDFQQMGESLALGQAVTNPIASRLQRVFGISQLRVDPSFTTGSDVPTARLALQQRITSNITFTYVEALDDPNSEVVRVEWAFNPRYSAVATRDQNGIFSLNFFYKLRIR